MNSASTAKAGRREWLGLAVLALSALMLSVDISVLFLALPQLSADLEPSITQQLWISDIYGFMLAGFLVTMGTLGDRIGRRRLLLIGAAAFGTASVMAAFSLNAPMLIVSRAILGIAGATLAPSTLALISNMFRDEKQRGSAIAIWTSCFIGGIALGPVLGGVLLDTFWWGSAFLIGVPVMAVLLVVGPRVLPEFRDPNAGRLDLTSVALYLAAVLPAIYGFKEIARNGWQPVPIATVGAGVAFGVLCVRRQWRLANPLFDLRLFRNRTFRSVVTIFLLVGVVQSGAFLMVNLYLQLVEGLSPLQAGLRLLPAAFAMIAATMAAPRIASRIRPASVMAASLVISAAGYLVISRVPASMGVTALMVGLAITNVGVGPIVALGYGLVLSAAPPEKAGSAASVNETGGEFGVALGIALLGSLGTAIYRFKMEDAIPAGVRADIADAARESISGAVSAAAHVPGRSGAGLLEAAHQAFTTALNTVAGISAIVFVGLAVLAAISLRELRPVGESEAKDAQEAGGVPASLSEIAVSSLEAHTQPSD
jgi:DHA2 family multidrug resistance protein-like MFS transporter